MKKILLIATSLFVLGANSASACSCLPATPQEYFKRSSAVFSGKVIDVVEQSSGRAGPSRFLEGRKVIFQVSRVWKGKNERQLVVMTSDSSASCGYEFQEGQEYLVYASNEEARLQTGLCNGTKLFSDARADLAILGQGETPATESSNPLQFRLQQNRRAWRTQNISNYRYTLRVSCFCVPEVTQPVVIEVRDGRVASIVAANSRRPVNPEYFKQYNSIPKLFNVIENAIANKAHRVSVTFHPTLGYPTQISIDQSQQIADEERYLTIEKLEVIR